MVRFCFATIGEENYDEYKQLEYKLELLLDSIEDADADADNMFYNLLAN